MIFGLGYGVINGDFTYLGAAYYPESLGVGEIAETPTRWCFATGLRVIMNFCLSSREHGRYLGDNSNTALRTCNLFGPCDWRGLECCIFGWYRHCNLF